MGFEPTRANTEHLKCFPLDQLGQVSAKYLIGFSICNLFYLWELASSWQIKLRTTWFEQVTNRSTVDRSTNWAMSGRTRPNLLLEAMRFSIGTNPRFRVPQRESNPHPVINSDKYICCKLPISCSCWGSNPRPSAHKTDALPTELQEHNPHTTHITLLLFL